MDAHCFPDAGPVLRSAFKIPPGVPINLSAITDPPPGVKPAAPLEELVQLAIYGSSRGKLTLREIYSAIEDRFEYFRTNKADNWKASIRHMLSLKSIFVRTRRPQTYPGRGDFWQLNVAVTSKFKRPRKRNRSLGKQFGYSQLEGHVDDVFCQQSLLKARNVSFESCGLNEKTIPYYPIPHIFPSRK